MDHRKILPFYMTYPLPLYYEDEHELIKDMEYLQGQHPIGIRTLQGEIAQTMNLMDYSGSMIYDEYPDRYSLLALTKSICRILEKEEDCQPAENMIQILLFNEVYKRRHGGHRGNIYF